MSRGKPLPDGSWGNGDAHLWGPQTPQMVGAGVRGATAIGA